jgi:GTPase SAR1 family protein
MPDNYIVAFVGLPSSGKSTLINSLVHKRLLQSGICRTTTEYKLIDKKVIDDNNNTFNVIDLPGICDSEEHDNKFNDMTYAHITNANLIFWVSDINKAFITTHEVNEFNKLRTFLQKHGDETGTLYDIGIILTKCTENYDIGDDKITKPDEIDKFFDAKNEENVLDFSDDSSSCLSEEEIKDLCEDTNANDVIDKVKTKFNDIKIKLFNAHGRCCHHPKSSKKLIKFIQNLGGNPSKNNIKFDISIYNKTYDNRQKDYKYELFEKKFEECMKKFVKKDFDSIMNIYASLDSKKKEFYENKYINNKNVIYESYYNFIEYVYNNESSVFNCENLYISSIFWQLNNNKYFNNQTIENYCNKILMLLKDVSHKEKAIWCNEIYKLNGITNINKKQICYICFNVNNNVIYYNVLKNLLNTYFTENNTSQIDFIDDLYKFHIDYDKTIRSNLTTNEYLAIITDDLLNDKYYLIKNKIDAYKIITKGKYYKKNILINEHIDAMKNKNELNLTRITQSVLFNELLESFLRKVYENIQMDVIDIKLIQPFAIEELLFA